MNDVKKAQLKVEFEKVIFRTLCKQYDVDPSAMPPMSDNLCSIMADAALAPLFACVDMQQYQLNNDLLKE